VNSKDLEGFLQFSFCDC